MNTRNSVLSKAIIVSSEMFVRTYFSLIFASLLPHEFYVLTYKESLRATKTIQTLVCEFKTSRIIQKKKVHDIKVTQKFPNLQYVTIKLVTAKKFQNLILLSLH